MILILKIISKFILKSKVFPLKAVTGVFAIVAIEQVELNRVQEERAPQRDRQQIDLYKQKEQEQKERDREQMEIDSKNQDKQTKNRVSDQTRLR